MSQVGVIAPTATVKSALWPTLIWVIQLRWHLAMQRCGRCEGCNPNHGLAGSLPIWKPAGTLISHIEEETWEARSTLNVSYIGSPLPEPVAPCNTLTGI